MHITDSSFQAANHAMRPERNDASTNSLERVAGRLVGRINTWAVSRSSRIQSIVPRVECFSKALQSQTDPELKSEARSIGFQMRRQGFKKDLVARTFAIVRELSGRQLGMRHFPSQLMGGWILLKGMVAEMETGEGKTLTATLAAATAALAGIPVHVITVNDYLTGRDAELMGPLYRALGLTVGCVSHEVPPERRRGEYLCDITYCTNKEIAFDYLRDSIALGDRREPLRLLAEHLYGQEGRVKSLLLRGLHFAIVDEADSIFIDEARTPLIISRSTENREERCFLEQGLALAADLNEGTDFKITEGTRSVELTGIGQEKIRKRTLALGPLWSGTVRREDTIQQALSALHLFRRDEHYLVNDGKVQIVDEFTGRLMPDRSWERGLHQFIELKEACELTGRRETLARISYQQFFRRYLRLSGMTGTAREVAGEMSSVYGLAVVRVPTNRPLQRVEYPDQIHYSLSAKWKAVVDRVRQLNNIGRPVLVGTRSVAASEHASRLLTESGIEHRVLNAKMDQEEAEIVAGAGEKRKVTIATNMAGRGTDIKLGEGVADLQGLHVILTERHEAARIDRQLAGRCGRQGDPGSYEAILSLDDPLLETGSGGLCLWIARRFPRLGFEVLGRRSIRVAQRRVERYHAGIRRDLVKQFDDINNLLSFSGGLE